MATRVLLVDDDRTLLRALQRSLEERFDIEVAASAAEALELLRNDTEINCVISDIKMPQMDGIELVKTIGAAWPEIPCILLTGNQDEGTLRQAAELDVVTCVLNKPTPGDELVAAVQAALKSSDQP